MNSKLNLNSRKEVKGVDINVSQLSRDLGISWNTAKKIVTGNTERKPRVFNGPYILDEFKDIIDSKLSKYDCTGTSIFYFISKNGYEGSKSTVLKYVSLKKDELRTKAAYLVEHTPGLLAQVDWKESMTLYTKNHEPITINVFLYVLAFSKFKYIELTPDRTQNTLFKSIINAFLYSGSKVPTEIWFDNMKTVVDSHDINTGEVIFNSKFLEFSKNASFTPIACKPYRPCTKGIAENLAKIMERLRAFNEEFETYDDLFKIVRELNTDLNNEVSSSTNEKPINMYREKEKEYLSSINTDQFNYKSNRPVRLVDNASMVNFNSNKYSVPTMYIGELVEIDVQDSEIHIYYSGKEISCHQISGKHINYRKEDLIDILPSIYKNASKETIEKMAEDRLKGLDLKHNKNKENKK